MRRLWTTAAAAALCVLAADAWAAPSGGRLELIATHHHAKSTDKTTDKKSVKTSRRHGRGKAEASSESRHERRSRHGLRIEKTDEPPAHGRRGRHHAQAAASEETSHARGRRGRHHAEETRSVEPRGRRGRHHAEEAVTEEPTRGRRGRHGRAPPSEIKTEAGAGVKVARRDTLDSLSHKTGVPTAELAKLNGLKKPYHVRLGARLKLPERRYYVVKGGDTLYSLGRRFGVDAGDLSAFNSMELGHHLRKGQKLYLPRDAEDRSAPVVEEPPPARPVRRPTPRTLPSFVQTVPAPSQGPLTSLEANPQAIQPPPQGGATSASPTTPQPYRPPASSTGPSSQGFELTPSRPTPYQPSPQASRPLIQSGPAPSAADVAAAGRGKFIWPVGGALISGYGPKPDGQKNDGLNIAGSAGDPIRAAADGEVVYAGDQVPSFGNLVLVKHPGGWVTAYAHMARILVHNRDQVVQGQQLGVVGQTGSVDRPQLHFEIRYAPSPKDKATPVDPGLVLPQR